MSKPLFFFVYFVYFSLFAIASFIKIDIMNIVVEVDDALARVATGVNDRERLFLHRETGCDRRSVAALDVLCHSKNKSTSLRAPLVGSGNEKTSKI